MTLASREIEPRLRQPIPSYQSLTSVSSFNEWRAVNEMIELDFRAGHDKNLGRIARDIAAVFASDEVYGKLRLTPEAIYWTTDEAVAHTTGLNFAIPTIVLRDEEVEILKGSSFDFGHIINLPLGRVTRTANTDRSKDRDFSVIILTANHSQGYLPMTQRLRPMQMMTVDPNQPFRRDINMIISHMIAAVSPGATPNLDPHRVDLNKDFVLQIIQHLNQPIIQARDFILDNHEHTDLTMQVEGQLAYALTTMISKLTEQYPNSAVIRLLMSCKTLEDITRVFRKYSEK